MQTMTHDKSRAPMRLGLLVVAFVLAMLGSMGSATAVAQTSMTTSTTLQAASPTSSQKDGAVCSTKGGEGKVDYLPVYRWSDATGSFHTRYSAVDLSNVPDRVVNTAFTSTGFSLGNAMWQLSTNLVEMATRACPLDSAGGLVDKNAGKLAKAIMSSGIVTALVVVSILGIAFRGIRQGGNIQWKSLAPKGIAIGLFAILMAGAASSTGGGIVSSGDPNGAGQYQPGLGSPGWFATRIDRTISSLTAVPVAALSGGNSADGIAGAGVVTGSPTNKRNDFKNSCPRYVKELNSLYEATYGNSPTEKMIASTPKALSAMWETTGLRSWRKTQFGTANYSGSHMYCYGLEKERDVPVTTATKAGEDSDFNGGSVADVTKKMGIGTPNPAAPVWKRTSNSDELDQQLVMLAECRLVSGTITTGKSSTAKFLPRQFGNKDRPQVTDNLCRWAFGLPPAAGKKLDIDSLNAFDWPPRERKSALGAIGSTITPGGDGAGDNLQAATIGTSTIDKYAADDGARDYLRSLHGDAAGTSLVLTMAFVISSFTILIAFGMISIAILVAKIMALVLIFMIFFVILGMLLPNADNNKLMQFVKQYAGLSFFIFGFQLILSILVLLTKMLIQIGNDAISNDFFNLIWVGFAPVLALFAMHVMFKKMSMPSPLSINAGMSWGKAAAAGAIGGAAGGAIGAGLMSRMGNSAKDVGKSALGNRLGNGENGGKGAMLLGGKGAGGRVNTMKPNEKVGGKGVADELDATQTVGADGVGAVAAGASAAALVSSTPEGAKATVGEKVSDMKAASAAKAADKQDRKDARHESGIGERASRSVSSTFAKAASDMKNKPVRTMAKAGLAVGAVGVMGPGVLLGAGLYMGAKKGIGSSATAMNMDTETNRDALARSAEARGRRTEAARLEAESQRKAEAEREVQNKQSAPVTQTSSPTDPGAGGESPQSATVPAAPAPGGSPSSNARVPSANTQPTSPRQPSMAVTFQSPSIADFAATHQANKTNRL
jgi:hypothetical protein